MATEYVRLTEKARKSFSRQPQILATGICAIDKLEVVDAAQVGALWVRCPVKGTGFVKLEADEWEEIT